MALFGIKRIQYCKATQLAFSGQNNPFLGIASEPTNTFTDVVCMINSRATLTIEQAVVNKQIVYTAKLQFVTPADPMLDVDHYAFIATTNEGERILLGANTRPQVAVVTAQGVFGNAGELTAYTTTAEFKADYRPLRLPVTAAEPISGPAYDICCGQIPQPTAPDTREFDICCGQIKTAEPISGPAYDVCCGEIVGENTHRVVVWLDYYGNVVDSAEYEEGDPEPAAPTAPTLTSHGYTFRFKKWQLLSTIGVTTYYKATYYDKAAAMYMEPNNVRLFGYSAKGERFFTMQGTDNDYTLLKANADSISLIDDNDAEIVASEYTALDWTDVDAMLSAYNTTMQQLGCSWLYNTNNDRIGYYKNNYTPTVTTTWHLNYYEGDELVKITQSGRIGDLLTFPTPTRSGYRLVGWKYYNAGELITTPLPKQFSPALNFYAVWEQI